MSTASTFGKELLQLAPSDIHIPTRLGLYFPDKAAALGRLMAIHGQRTPITVRKSAKGIDQPWTLVVGMHRLNGAIIEDLPFVFALERIGGSDADAKDEEASENLDRRDQPPLERAIFIYATCEAARLRISAIHGTDNPKVIGGRARQKSAGDTMSPAGWDQVKAGEMRPEQALQQEADDTSDTMSRVYGWVESVAEAFGRGKRTIYRALKLHKMLIEPFPELIQALSDHPVVGDNEKQLLELAGLESLADRRAAIEAILANPELSADEARVLIGADRGGPAATPVAHQKFYNQIVGGWGRLGKTEQNQFLRDNLPSLLTPGQKRDLRDRLNEELGDAR